MLMIMVIENQDTLAVQEDKKLPCARQNSQASKQSFNFNKLYNFRHFRLDDIYREIIEFLIDME